MRKKYKVGEQVHNVLPEDVNTFLAKHPGAVLVSDDNQNQVDTDSKIDNKEDIVTSDNVETKSEEDLNSELMYKIAIGEANDEEAIQFQNLIRNNPEVLDFDSNLSADKGWIHDIWATSNTKKAWDTGTASGSTVEEALIVFNKGPESSDEEVQRMIDAVNNSNSIQKGIGQTDSQVRFNKAAEEYGGGILGVLHGFYKEPGYIDEFFAQSFGVMYESFQDSEEVKKSTVAGGVLGGGVAATTSAVAAATVSGPLAPITAPISGAFGYVSGTINGAMAGLSRSMETGLTFSELLQEELKLRGDLDFNLENIKDILNDKDAIERIQSGALGRGNVISGVGFVTMGMSRGISTQLVKKGYSTLPVALATVGTEFTGDYTGELGGQLAAGTPINELDFTEAALEGFGSIADIGFAADVIVSAKNIVPEAITQTIKGSEYTLNGESVTKQTITNILESENVKVEDLAQMNIEVKNDNAFQNEVASRQNDAITETQINSKITNKNDRVELVTLEKIKVGLLEDVGKTGINAVPGSKKKLQEVTDKIDGIIKSYESVDGRTKNVRSNRKIAEQVRKKRRDISVEKTIKFAKEQGKVIGKETLVAENNKDAQVLFDKARSEYNAKNPNNPIAKTNVADADGFIIGNTIVINKDVSGKTGQINVGAHELLHGIVAKHMDSLVETDSSGNVIDNSKLIEFTTDFRNQLTKDQRNYVESIIEKRNDAGENLDINTTEEWLTIFSDGISKGDIKFDESVFSKMKNFVQEIARKVGYKKEFENSRQVYNFMKDYQASITKNKLSDRAIQLAGEGTQSTEVKLSKDAKPEVDELGKMGWTKSSWKSTGANFAIEEMQSTGMLDRLIASKLKVPMSVAATKEFTQKVYAELTSHAKNFNPEVNDSFFGWINSQISNKAGNVYNREYKVNQRTQDIDAKTADGAPVIQVEADITAETDFIDNIGLTETQVEQKSKLKKQLGIDNNLVNKVKASVIKTFGTKLPEVNSKKFKLALQNAFKTELKKPIQDMIGSKEKYNNFLKNNFKSIFNALPVETLIQMERSVKPENRIFTTSRRITKVTEVDKLISQGKLPKDTNRKSGPQLHNKNKYPGTDKVIAFFRGENMNKQLGYEVGASTLGTRKDKLASEIGVELGFDATMEIVQQPEVIERRKGILDLQGQEILDNDIAVIAKQIDRDPRIKFSKSTKSGLIEGVKNLVDEVSNANAITDVFNLDTQKYIGKSKPSELVQQLVFKHWLNNNIILDPNKAVVKIVNKIPKSIIKKNRGTAFEQYLIDLGLNSKHKGFKMLVEKVAEGGIPDFYAEVNGAVFNAEVKFGIARAGKTTINAVNYKTLEFAINKYSGGNKNLIDASVARALKKGAKKLRAELKKQGVDLIDGKTKVPMAAHAAIGKTKALVSDASATVDGDFIANLYNNKKYPVHYIEIAGAGLYYLGSDPLGIAAELGIPKLEGNFPLKTRILPAGYKENGVTAGYRYGITAEPTISADLVTELSPVSMTDVGFFDKLMNSEAAKLLDAKQTIEKNNKIAKVKNNVSKQIKILQADLEKRGYEFSGTVSSSEAGRITKFSKSISRGMSTFDFDETLIIDGKNFVTATDPITKETIKISSGDWPIKGPELSAKGYTMNFDDFVNVRGGIEGPLFQKFKNRIEKYGIKNNFILTARPQQASIAIKGWLESKGINMPIENITGLGDGTGRAKAQWMIDKFAEGYNDMYFVDDALPNVQAVKDALNQLDIKGSSVQAKIKFSISASNEFNDILERVSGVGSKKVFSDVEARNRGKSRNIFDTFVKSDYLFVPPSAEDFKGLTYRFLGKGKKGDADAAWFKKNLFDPYSEGIRNWNTYKQNMSNEYLNLKKKSKDISKNLGKKVSGTNFSVDTAIRTYLWNQNKIEIPGISKAAQKKLVDYVKSDKKLMQFANELSVISRSNNGYVKPGKHWMVETISSDLANQVNKVGRAQFMETWIENKNVIFSNENLNKIEAIHGSGFRDALENSLYRMEKNTNRTTGKDPHVNKFLNWINGSVGAVMFFNIRSAVLQTMSTVNFINWGDNNMFKASKAFANQPQYWKDFSTIFNSDMLKQRRAGLAIDVSASELTKAFAEGNNKPQAIINYLLEKGFTPTRVADSFAISMGGASFYRNRLNTYTKKGMNIKDAEKQAFLDFQEVAEETQQSSRPDLISQQQSGTLGRIILAWQNTPMQMTRLTKKAISDLVNGRGDVKANVSKIIYYGVAQNLIFGALQSGLAFMMFGGKEEEEEKQRKEQRVLNGAFDSLLRGTGVYGAALVTLKNTIARWQEEEGKKYGRRDDSRIMLEAISLSPPIGSKLRKINNAIKTHTYNKGVGKKLGFRIENPNLSIASNLIEGATNFPLSRLVNKANNIEEALTGNHEMWQRTALIMGWDKWSVGVKDEELEAAKAEVKQDRKDKKKEEARLEKIKKEKEEQERKEKEGIKTVQCSGTKSNGKRCSIMIETKNKSAKCVYHKDFVDGSDTDKDGIKEYICTATKTNGKRCKNRTENKNKKCYAHQ